ncbi:LacI family DNA-binding transcriptional regulator [Pseudogracilibacillus auburnensis]|uniref:LacI family DNA-binding transcriptional regulator n=1 Tax=Pseudogracilibacillus auburnensis TaxID=1494959 RepID=UPI001A976DB3|nr:LacI family DNA-binding transcriptional regulator [Pseudogracilibacillus auburnensis]MBO1005704.1 LacI family DNA-binding transcriptional regulator [Pseudogracilibacillus auburnensis]
MTTIKDIARVAGVSVTTVSRALNGYSDVSEKTRAKVFRIAKELNYSPNTLARGLVMNKSKTFGLLVSGLNESSPKDNITFDILSGINKFVGECGYDLVLFSTNSTKQREKTYTQLCRERRVDGVIIQGIRTDDPYLKEVVESDIPCVLIDIPLTSSTVGYVTTDNVLGAKKAVKHLIQLGHRNIGFINGHEFAFVSQERLKGYEEALTEANIEINREWIGNGEFSEEAAEIQAIRLLEAHPEITAIFSASDLMALGVIKAARSLGIKVPDNLSIIGFDDIVLASYVTPSLTTIGQDTFQIGYEAAQLLLSILENRAESHIVTMETKLKVRESTKHLNE